MLGPVSSLAMLTNFKKTLSAYRYPNDKAVEQKLLSATRNVKTELANVKQLTNEDVCAHEV